MHLAQTSHLHCLLTMSMLQPQCKQCAAAPDQLVISQQRRRPNPSCPQLSLRQRPQSLSSCSRQSGEAKGAFIAEAYWRSVLLLLPGLCTQCMQEALLVLTSWLAAVYEGSQAPRASRCIATQAVITPQANASSEEIDKAYARVQNGSDVRLSLSMSCVGPCIASSAVLLNDWQD